MEEELILQQPIDRRLGNSTDLPPGPPGAECDSEEFVTKPLPKTASVEKEPPAKKSSSRRRSKSPKRKSPARSRVRSPSPTTIRRRRSPSPSPRLRRSPSPSPRRRRSPSPRRGRYYSPERRRYDRRRSPIRRDSPPQRRYGGGMRGGIGRRSNSSRSRSRSRSRSPTPPPKRRAAASGSRWANKDKQTGNMSMGPVPPPTTQGGGPSGPPPVPYGVMPPNSLYPNDGYGNTPGYNQYVVPPPPPQAGFPPQPDAYGAMQPPPAPGFNAGYPPPQPWGAHDPYVQQPWMGQATVPDAAQIQQPAAVTTAMSQMAQTANVTAVRSQSQEFIGDAAPGTADNAVTKSATTTSSVQDAVAQEAENQRDELKHQRNSYLNKTSMLKLELKMLKDQRMDLESGGAPPSPTTKNFIEENQKLQTQIEKKLSAIENVIDMLTNLIGEENLEKDNANESGQMPVTSSKDLKHAVQLQPDETATNVNVHGQTSGHGKKRQISTTKSSGGASTVSSSSDSSTGTGSSSSDTSSDSSTDNDDDDDDDDDSSSEKLKTKAIESMKSKQRAVGTISVKKDLGTMHNITAKEEKVIEEKFNYIFYDPETHWCQICNVFPKTARDYLNHLHTKEHMDREGIDTPWHLNMINDQFPSFDNAPVKRQAIRGLTFFVPATAWFCKLCNFWMGDLHCASTHLKSQQHSEKYNAFLAKNPQHETNWLAERQRILSDKTAAAAAAAEVSLQSAAIANENLEQKSKKTKKDDSKANKKRKKKSSDKKDKKKKHKHSKKRKKAAASSSSSSSSSDSSTTDNDEELAKTTTKKKAAAAVAAASIVIKDLDNPNPAASIRVAMRKQENGKLDAEPQLTAPVVSLAPPTTTRTEQQTAASKLAERLSKWSQENIKPELSNDDSGIIQQWNNVQPVISDSEKKLLEQLKGKLKNKPTEEPAPTTINTAMAKSGSSKDKPTNSSNTSNEKNERDKQSDREKQSEREKGSGTSRNRRELDNDRRGSGRRGRSRSPGYERDRYRGARSRSRSRSRSRGGFGYRRGGGNSRRSRSRSRGRNLSPLPRGGGGRGRRGRSPSPRRNRRSRSRDRRRRSRTRSRTRSRSRSGSYTRIEKPVVKHSEFRPRVPEKDKEKEKKAAETKDKKEISKKNSKTAPGNSSSTNSGSAGGNGGSKKLPFIGKMPVFKKQAPADGVPENGSTNAYNSEAAIAYTTQAAVAARPPAPTAAQIQMAMMEDVYGNAPPFHPDAGMMMDYDDLMPDPMQFANIMGQGIPPPPPPPPPATGSTGAGDAAAGHDQHNSNDAEPDDDADILPPGIDANEDEEEYTPKPIAEPTIQQKGPLPKDLEEALDIIFPTEKNVDDDSNDSTMAKKRAAAAAGQTHIIVDEPVMQVEDLIKEGIHMVSIEETSMLGMDEASKMSMNEPLVFNNKKSVGSSNKFNVVFAEQNLQANVNENATDIDIRAAIAAVTPPPPPPPPLTDQTEVSANAAEKIEVIAKKDDINSRSETRIVAEAEKKKGRSRSNSTSSNDSNSSSNSGSSSSASSSDTDASANVRNAKSANNINNNDSNSKVVTLDDMDIVDMEQETLAEDDNATIPQGATPFCATTIEYDLNDIPEPPASPTESEKNRRKEELDDLAMLGIDADDMAAQCM